MLTQLALLPALISLSVLAGWIFQWPFFISPVASGPPMVFNTALCVFFLSLSILSHPNPWLRAFRNGWLLTLALSGLSAIQILFEINLHIDEVFVKGAASPFLTEPGRMPAASTFCLFLASLAWGALLNIQVSRILFGIFAFCTYSSVLFLGVFALVNAVVLSPLDHSWQSFSLIPFHTGVCILVLGSIGLSQSLQHLTNQPSFKVYLYGIASGIVAFFVTLIVWQYSLERNSRQIDIKFQSEVSVRTERMTALLTEYAESFKNMKAPDSVKEAKDTNWKPPFQAEAVIRLGTKPTLIWTRTDQQLDRDLALLSEQILDHSKFHFYPSFYYQRARWFAFSNSEHLLIFSNSEWIQAYFPDDLFSHSLVWRDQVLCSNVTGFHKVLVEWKRNWPLSIMGADLNLQVTPTHRLYDRMSSLNPLHFLLAGLSFSCLVGLSFSGLLYVKRRFLR